MFMYIDRVSQLNLWHKLETGRLLNEETPPPGRTMSVEYGFEAHAIVAEGRITIAQIQHVKEWLTAENLHLTDEQVVLFSLSCLNELEDAKTTIRSYCTTKKIYPVLFTNRSMRLLELQQQLQVVDFAVFPKRTVDGCAIVFHRLRDTNFRRYHMETAMKLLFMTLDAAIYDHPPTGLVMLFDMKGVGLLHLTRVRLRAVQVFCQYLQEALPVKLTVIHVLNTVNFLERVLNILRPFVKAELLEQMNFHSTQLGMDEFHAKYIPRECLPVDYGGELEPLEVLARHNTRRLFELETFFETEENQQKRNII